MIKFSIAIPAYKRQFLQEAIESCLSQTYRDFELVIVDDASPYDLSGVVALFDDARIKFFRNEKNCGAENVVDNWNICLGHCTGDYIICMGDDDRLLPCCLEEYARAIEENPGVGLLHGWTEIIDGDGFFVEIGNSRVGRESAYSMLWSRWRGSFSQFIGDWCFNIGILRAAGGFYKLPFGMSSDDITALECASVNGVVNVQALCFQYRRNDFTVTNNSDECSLMDSLFLSMEWYRHFLEREPEDETDRKFRLSLQSKLPSVYRGSARDLLSRDMASSPLGLVYWLRHAGKYGLTKAFVLYSFFLGVGGRMMRGH